MAGRIFIYGALGLFALAVLWIGRRLQSPQLWRALDGLVALMMWGTAAMLAVGLWRA